MNIIYKINTVLQLEWLKQKNKLYVDCLLRVTDIIGYIWVGHKFKTFHYKTLCMKKK